MRTESPAFDRKRRLLFDVKTIIGVSFKMVLQIRLDHFFSQLTGCYTKIAACPKMPAPVPFLYLWKLLEYLRRGMTLDPTHQFRRRYRRWRRYQNMHMISAHNTTDDLNLESFAYLTYQFTNSIRQITSQQMVSIFGHPHKMVFNLIFGMASITIFHANCIIQLLAESYLSKNGGFNLRADE